MIYGDVPQGATLAHLFFYFDTSFKRQLNIEGLSELRWHLGERPLLIRV